MTEFPGKTLTIRSVKPTDIPQVMSWGQGSTESFFLLNFPLMFNRDDLARELDHKDTELLIIENKSDLIPLGLCKLGPLRMPEKQTQLRFTIKTYPDYSAEKAQEAPKLLLDYLFNKAGLTKVQAYTLEYEKEYEFLLKKLGFQKEGAYQHHFFHKEHYYSVNIFGLLKEDFIL